MTERRRGASRAREAARRWLPFPLRAWVMRSLASPAPEQAPALGLEPVAQGAIDEPAQGAAVGDVAHVVGWAMWNGRMASSVEVRVDGVLLGRARLGVVRPDLEALGGEGIAAGFEFHAPLAGPTGAVRVLSAVARFAGERRLVITGPTVAMAPRRAPTERARTPRRAPSASTAAAVRVLVVTHQLDLGGGQLYLQDLVRGLVRTERFQVTVASCLDGPLRAELEDLGVTVHLTGRWPQHSMLALDSRLDEFAAWVLAGRHHAVLVNTAIGFPAVSVAARLGLPCIWAIHESYPMPLLAHALLGSDADPAVAALVTETLRQADRLIFEAESTRRLYATVAGDERCLLVPYGVELAALDEAAAALDRVAVRRSLDLPPQGRVLLCMGTFEVRKGQTMLVRAFADVADRHPDASLVLVGDNGSDYAGIVRRLAAATGLGPRIRLVPVGPDVLPWYAAADVLVSASDVESTPRSAVEAMYLETVVLAADVYGLAELVEEGVSGWLVGARDLDAMVAGMDRALGAPDRQLRQMARRARDRIRLDHDAAGYVGTVAALLSELAGARVEPPAKSRGG